jgi:hypothetical protein
MEAECETRTLDSFALRPTFIKIDVEGLEHEVLVWRRLHPDRATSPC